MLKHIKRVRAKGRIYLYFDTGKVDAGKRIYARLPDLKAPEFARVYATMLGHRHREKERGGSLTVPALLGLYEKSDAWRKLKPGSERIYTLYSQRLAAMLPTAPAGEVTRADMVRMVDKMADTPGAANMFLAVASAMYRWGADRGHVAGNPCEGIKPLDVGEHHPWPAPILQAALASDEPAVRLLVHLLYYTAQRLGDVLAMRWTDIRDGVIYLAQQKTGKSLAIPLHSTLASEMTKTPRTGLLIVSSEKGIAVPQASARKQLKAFCASLGSNSVPHGLRKNAVIALLEAGCSIAETAAISGQSLQMVEHYAKERNQHKLASAAVLRWERNG